MVISEILSKKQTSSGRTKYAFWVLAAIQLPVPILLFVFKFTKSNALYFEVDHKAFMTNDQIDGQYDDMSERNAVGFKEKVIDMKDNLVRRVQDSVKSDNWPVVKMSIYLAMLVFLFDGLQATHGGYIFAYAVKKFDIDSSATPTYAQAKNGTKIFKNVQKVQKT